MANKKKRPEWMDAARQQATSGTPYASREAEQTARNTPAQRTVSTASRIMQRGTGSQTTERANSISTGLEILQSARAALNGEKAERKSSVTSSVDFGSSDRFDPAAWTYGTYEPTAQERGRIGNTLGAGGNSWIADQANALGFVLDPEHAPKDAEMMFGKAPTTELGERNAAKIDQALKKQSEKSYAAADRYTQKAAEHEAAAKKGLSGFSKFLVDAGIAGTQMGMDATVGNLTGTGMLSMGTRTFGGSSREALDAGASNDQALAYGFTSAAVELGAEKLFDAMKLFGGGSADELIEGAVKRWAKTDKGRTALRILGSMGGESAEEAISGVVNPFLRQLYDPNAVKDTYGTKQGRIDFALDTLYDAAVGGFLGAAGGAGSIVNGVDAQKNAALRASEAAEQRVKPNGVETLMNASSALNAQNAPESPVTNAAAREGNLTAEPKTALTQRETGQNERSTSIDTNPETHTPEQMQTIREYKGAVNNKFLGWVNRVRSALRSGDMSATKMKLVLDPVGDNTAAAIMRETGVDVTGFSHMIDGSAIRHIDERHGDAGEHDSTMQNPEDLARAEYVIENSDKCELAKNANGAPRYSTQFFDKNNRPAPMVVFTKRVDGSYYVVEAVPDSTDRKLHIVSAYMENASGGIIQELNMPQNGPQLTPEAPLGPVATTDTATLPPNAPNVKNDANGLPEGQGAMSPAFAYREAATQTNSTNPAFAEEERSTVEGLRPEDSTHQVRTDKDVVSHARERLQFDYDGEKAALFEQGREWDAIDREIAHQILEAEIAKARLTGDYSEVVRIKKETDARGTNWGQVGHTMARHAHTAADIVGEAATTLDGQEGAQETLDEIAGLAAEWEQAKAQGNGGAQSMKDLILRLNAIRRTGGFFNGKKASGTLQSTIDAVSHQDGGLDFLTDIAEAQLRNLSADHAKLSPLEAVKSVRYLAMLSKFNTTMRNLVGNTVFDVTETLSNNVVAPLDMFLSLRTGRRTTAHDASWFSAAKRQGAKEAAQRAYIETALDADLGDTANRFEQRTGRTFKMNSRNPVERFLSSMEKWQRYMLTVTDEFAKGGTRAEQQRGIDRLTESGKLEQGALDGWADETAKQRTFQNEGNISSALQNLRNAGNVLSIKDKRGGSFGLGDAILPFAQVPGNVAGQFFNYSPAGLMKGAVEVLSVLKAGKNATAQQQAQAVRDVGRGMTGTSLVALFTAMAANGLLKVAGDDDKDKAALERDEGISGTQLNIDAALRWLRGEDPAWQDGDDLMSIGFLEPFNGDMAMGYMLAEAYKDAAEDGNVEAKEIASAIVDSNTSAALQAVMDLPAMSTLKNIGDAYEYSTADTTAGKMADAGVQFAGDTAASFVPNAVAGIAQGMDEGRVRVTRTSDKTGAAGAAENALNSIKSKLPGLRETLPQAADSWGQPRQTTASPLQNWFNSNILPGAVTQYRTNAVNQELYRLMETQDVKAPARNPVKEVQAGDEKKRLNTGQQRTYQRKAGQASFQTLRELMRTDQYKGMTDAERAAAFNAILQFGKTQGAQAVGGSAEDPSWSNKSDGSVAQNAAFYGILQRAKQQLDKDERGKTAPVVAAIYGRGLDDETTLGVLQQHLDEKQIAKVQNAVALGYKPEDVAEFWGYMNSVNGGKEKTKQWALSEGYTLAEFNELWALFH